MSWSRQFISVGDFNNATDAPDGVDAEQYAAARDAAQSIIDTGVLAEPEVDSAHLDHPDNRDQKLPQAGIRITLSGHRGQGSPSSITVTVSEP